MQTIKETVLEKSISNIVVEIIEYIPNVLSRTIIRKMSDNTRVSSFVIEEGLEENISPFDTYIQIIDGAVELTINQKKHKLKLGDSIIIPAYSRNRFNADVQFKIIATVIKDSKKLNAKLPNLTEKALIMLHKPRHKSKKLRALIISKLYLRQ